MTDCKAVVKLKPREGRRIRAGHLWIFSNEIEAIEGDVEPGDAVRVVDARGRTLGSGYANPHSLIAVRLLSRSAEDLSRELFARRIDGARSYRERLWPGEKTYRAVSGEADLLPGLVVDRYDDVLAVQSLTAGIEVRLATILDILEEMFSPRAIVLRNDSAMREREGLDRGRSVARGTLAGPVEIEQNGHALLVDVLDGQKTGFFLDQRENRAATAPLARDRDVLDGCCYTGAWSVAAAAAGATSVTAIDASGAALALAAKNVERNGFADRVTFVEGDIFGELASIARSGRRFGFVILDPPAFARSRKRIREALKAYRAVNRLAMALTARGGHLVTCTCSHLVEREAFTHALVGAAKEAGRAVRVLEVRGQSRDHPVILGLPETDYLTCAVLEMI